MDGMSGMQRKQMMFIEKIKRRMAIIYTQLVH